jgi:threonine synthase
MRAVTETEGAFISVTDEQILSAVPVLARNAGVFAEPAGAAPYAALAKACASGRIAAHEKVVVLATGNGLKDVRSAIKAVGAPRRIEPALDFVDEALAEWDH